MSHPPELEALPTAGSLVGRHLIVREIAKGPVGPLYLARTQDNDGAIDTLARLIPIPADLPTNDDQFIAEAIWDSANVGHDLVLRVADVVAGKGWVALVHDYHVGSLLGSMHRRAGDLGTAFPAEVAARIALDLLEGLEQSRGLCEASRIPWRPGSIAIGSLYLCGDGRTRALDGQVVAAIMRSPHMRTLCGTASSVAPEMLDAGWEPDERTDVFAVGAVLWELLTGREIMVDRAAPIANVIHSVPRGTEVPQGLVHAMHMALELDPAKRQSTLRELAVELVMGAEKVASYEQVIEFASTLLPFEAAFQPAADDAGSQPGPAPHGSANPSSPIAATTPELEPQAPRFASPFAPLAPAPTQLSTSAQKLDRSSQPDPRPQPAAIDKSAAPTATPVATAPTTTPTPLLDPGGRPKGARFEQISWPDEDPPLRAAARVVAASPAAAEAAKKSNGAKPSRDQLDTFSEPVSSNRLAAPREQDTKDPGIGASPIDELRQEPTTKFARRDSGRPLAASKSAVPVVGRPSTRPTGLRPQISKPAAATALSEDGGLPDGAKKRGLQISSTTLILAFSTTVLAVVLIMILVQHQSNPAPTTAVPVPPAAQPVERTTPDGPTEKQEPGVDRSADLQAGSIASKTADAGLPGVTDARVERPKRIAKSGSKPAAKAAVKGAARAAEVEATTDDPKAPKKPKTYVPNDL